MDEFVTLEELAAYLSPRAPRDLSDDVLAASAVAGAATRIQTETGQDLLPADATATFAIERRYQREVIIPQAANVEVDEVRIDDEVSLDWHLLLGSILRVTDAGCFPYGSTVEVDYSSGYDPIPADLRLLAVTLAARVYQQGISRQEATGSSSVTFSVASSLDLSNGERALLAKYRMRRAPTVEGVPAAS
jgi:hypothetical protein